VALAREHEEAFLTAIAVAQRQKARSFVLRAALSLAKIYNARAVSDLTESGFGLNEPAGAGMG
jgi:hypothetical protein